jgi:NAD(P)-dependent dehydrogenase (short-subunit alcohol dehydrogenase family)
MIELVSRAETYLDQVASPKSKTKISKVADSCEQQLAAIAPIVRGLLATPTPGDRHSCQRVVLQALTDTKTNALLANLKPSLLVSPPLTGDHLFRTKPLPAWLQNPDFDDEESLRSQLESVLTAYSHNYQAYFERHKSRLSAVVTAHDAKPRVLFIDGLGALCAGTDATSARIVRDITDQTLAVKGRIAAMTGVYRVPGEEQLFDMEYLLQQQLKLTDHDGALTGTVAMVTGAAGAIGSGISARLLKAGAHVVIADVDESRLAEVREELEVNNADRVMAVRQDVSDPDSVAASFSKVFQTWGGLDSLVINAGLAHVSTLEQMDIDQFRRLEGVNTDGTLILLQAASQVFRKQRTGGDVVLISTKNVFAPGAEFGAYSATKAAAHQLARIASQEMAADDVRVNMVAPDAVFSHGTRRSGLWDEVGPGRMRARGLDEAGLEAYYRDRNLLKVRITADHVAEGVLFFLERRTPTTGATLPIDGGLPDATPR